MMTNSRSPLGSMDETSERRSFSFSFPDGGFTSSSARTCTARPGLCFTHSSRCVVSTSSRGRCCWLFFGATAIASSRLARRFGPPGSTIVLKTMCSPGCISELLCRGHV